ncbi:winged helix-turn-helix domain-containing protein [Streptomyces noursei]|uniref:winged helix-turn-helix domain-containing protein n=1 Tax=Streptomyces noursei TaxID=1971 RepID=UPI0037FEA200
MTFPAGLLRRTAERLIDTTEAPLRAVAHITCDIEETALVRNRLTQALTGHNIRLTNQSTRRDKPDSTLLEAAITTDGPVTTTPAQLLSLVCLEPSVSDLHRHVDPQSAGRPDDKERPHAPVYRLNDLVVDLGHRTVTILGHPVRLTCMEFELLAHLLTNPQRTYTHERLKELVWQQSDTDGKDTVDAHIARLRHKLGPRYGAVIASAGQSGYLLDGARTALGSRPVR